MKKRIIATFAIFALFALAIAAYAYTASTPTETVKACCCKKDGACPMKGMNHDAQGEHAKMSCPMHKGDQAGTAGHENADGCCGCCGDSCPMKKEGASATATSGDAKSCCDDCDCCKGKDKSTV
jgi:hypothetical protein